MEQFIEATRQSLRFGGAPSTGSEWVAYEIIERNNWRVAEGSRSFRSLLRMVGRGQIEAAYRQLQVLEAMPIQVRDSLFAAENFARDRTWEKQERAPQPLSDLFDRYVAEAKPAPATIKAYRRQFSAFIDFLGHDDAHQVQAEDVVRWKDELRSRKNRKGEPLSAKTVADTYIAVIKSVFSFGVENSRIEENVAAKLRMRRPKGVKTREKGLNDQAAQTILKATLSPPTRRLSVERVFARRWVPWICAYTGARVNEITQARAEDVQETDGVWTLLITPEAGSTKNGQARIVPLHTHLIEQGFVEAVQGKAGPLFYDPRRRRDGSVENPQSKKCGEHLAAWVRGLGVDDPRIAPNHGWRHRFKTIARLHRMDPETRDRIQGHVPRTEGETYSDFSPRGLLREIELLPPDDLKADDTESEN